MLTEVKAGMKQRLDIVRADASYIERIAVIGECFTVEGWTKESFGYWLERENSVIFAAICDNAAVGFVIGAYVIDEAELFNIAVLPEYRGNGIADKLMEQFENELLGLGVKKIFLEVRESNAAALSLYKKHGFGQISLRKNYYVDPKENAVIMSKEV